MTELMDILLKGEQEEKTREYSVETESEEIPRKKKKVNPDYTRLEPVITLNNDKIVDYLGRGKIEKNKLYFSLGEISKHLNRKPEKPRKKLDDIYSLKKYSFSEIDKIVEKETYSKKNYINKYNNIDPIIIKNFNSITLSPLGLNIGIRESASVNADNIGEFALPLVEYINQTQPDYVMASDRGARLLGLAVFKLHGLLYGRFPTADGTIKFRRFSKSNSQEDTEEHLQPLVDEMLEYKQRPRVLVLDDWVVSGGTQRLAREIFDKLGKGRIKVNFGVLMGAGADVSGHDSQTSGFASSTDWRDDSNIIGVRYGSDNFGYSGVKARPVRSDEAMEYRKRMYNGIEKFAKLVKEKKLASRSLPRE